MLIFLDLSSSFRNDFLCKHCRLAGLQVFNEALHESTAEFVFGDLLEAPFLLFHVKLLIMKLKPINRKQKRMNRKPKPVNRKLKPVNRKPKESETKTRESKTKNLES